MICYLFAIGQIQSQFIFLSQKFASTQKFAKKIQTLQERIVSKKIQPFKDKCPEAQVRTRVNQDKIRRLLTR